MRCVGVALAGSGVGGVEEVVGVSAEAHVVVGRWSLAMRRAVMVGVVAAVVCTGVSALIVLDAHDRAVGQNTDHALRAAVRTASLFRQNLLPSVVPERGTEAIQVVSVRGQVVATTQQLAGKPPMASFRAGDDHLILVRDLCPPAGLKGCMTVVSVRYMRPEGDAVIYAARPVAHVYENPALILFLAGVSVLVTALLAVGVHRLVGADMAQVQAIVDELAEITAADLARRVTVPATYEEIRRLAESVNSTLDRLEAAVEGLWRYASDVSHDLRSPITAIRVRLEEALMSPAETQWPGCATRLLEDVERLQAVVSDITGAGATGGRSMPRPRPDRPR